MNTGQFLILGYLLLASGALLLLGGVLAWFRAYQKYSAWKPARGIVTKVVSRSISPSDFHFYPAKHKQGQNVSVWYDARNPNNAVIDLAAAKWTAPLALGIFGAFAMIIGGMILSLSL